MKLKMYFRNVYKTIPAEPPNQVLKVGFVVTHRLLEEGVDILAL